MSNFHATAKSETVRGASRARGFLFFGNAAQQTQPRRKK
jgi:hypothetical protein